LERRTDQLAGALLDALAERGHDAALDAVGERYRAASGRVGDRDRLARTLVATVVDRLDPADCVGVVSDGVETLLDRFSAVIDAAPVAVVALDADDRIRLWNPAAERVIGWSEAEMLGRPYPAMPSPAEGDEAFLDRLRAGEELAGVETRHPRADGSSFDARLWAAPLDDGGEYAGAILIVADVTDRRRRRERLMVLNRVLRHNIRNDVNAICGYVDLLAAELPDGDERIAAIERRLDDVLELSETARRIERLDADEGRTRLDVASVLRERTERLRRTADGCAVGGDLPERAPVVAHRLLPYAFDALLDCLADRSRRVTVAADAPADGDVAIRIDADGSLPAGARRVLDGGTESPVEHSDGPGLWLARWIVDASRGEIAVDGDEGTTVVVTLRTARARSDPAPVG
jgi:PAS domain S-box-containing protein